MCRVHVESIRAACSARYSPAQIEAWIDGKTPKRYEAMIRGPHEWFVCECGQGDGRAIAGIASVDLSVGEVTTLYVAPDWWGKGVGRALFETLERRAIERGHTELRVESTLNARAAYERYGFVATGVTTHRFASGVEAEAVRMSKRIEQPAALHTMNPTERFTGTVKDYAAWRPSYPPGAIDAVLRGLGPPERLSIADIGAGTGISARLIAARGARVVAVEPNKAMREEGERTGSEGGTTIEWRDGTAEATGLADACVECVACAQSFHWFREREALDEFVRILRTRSPAGAPGRVALMWNDRDAHDPFTAAYGAIMREASGRHPAERDFDPRPQLGSHPRLTNERLAEAAHVQTLDERGVSGRALSASYAPKDAAGRDAMLAALHAAFTQNQSGGRVRMVYVTRVYLADVAPASTISA